VVAFVKATHGALIADPEVTQGDTLGDPGEEEKGESLLQLLVFNRTEATWGFFKR
jgi:hypothetical protein